jgi:hypothetical protein
MKKLLLILLCLPFIGFGQQTYVPTRDITYKITPSLTTSTITVDGLIISAFPTTISYPINQIVNISANLDPLYEFSSWLTDSIYIPNSPVASFFTSFSDTVTLNIVKKPIITYSINPASTATTINVNGIVISTFPTTISYPINQIVNIYPNLDPLYEFNSWSSNSVIVMPTAYSPVASFSANNDTILLDIVFISPTYDCVNNVCVDLGTGNGIYASLFACQSNCVQTVIQEHTTNKELLKVTDLLGRETNQTNQPLFYIYDDGTVEKRIVIE